MSILISLLFLGLGIACFAAYFFSFKVPPHHVLISRRAQQGRYLAGWNFGLKPSDEFLVPLQKQTLTLPTNNNLIQLQTPDDGVLGVAVSITYSPDDSDGNALLTYKTSKDLQRVLEARVQSALSSWIKRKPLPGTLKRALTMKDDAEEFVRAKITSIPSSASALAIRDEPTLYYQTGYPVNDLGVRIHEVHITSMQGLKNGTGSADWGDGEDATFNAQYIFKQFHAHADSLSNLRKLKEALLARYPDESDDIEDIYDQVRISMKENRDR
jgi:hypothetical protein